MVHLDRLILRLAPFKFKVAHIPGKTSVAADCFTRQFEGVLPEQKFSGLTL
jgi:hypothetical protein